MTEKDSAMSEDCESRQARIEAEKQRLLELFTDLDKGALRLADKLVDRVAFLTVTMEDLEQVLNDKGCISKYQNGANQWGTKKSPEAETYASMMQRYIPAMKQLLDLRPAAVPEGMPDPVKAFVERR